MKNKWNRVYRHKWRSMDKIYDHVKDRISNQYWMYLLWYQDIGYIWRKLNVRSFYYTMHNNVYQMDFRNHFLKILLRFEIKRKRIFFIICMKKAFLSKSNNSKTQRQTVGLINSMDFCLKNSHKWHKQQITEWNKIHAIYLADN